MKRAAALVALLATMISVTFAGQHTSESGLAARVNNQDITIAQYHEALNDSAGEIRRGMAGESEDTIQRAILKARRGVLEELIKNALLDQRARELGYTHLTESDIQELASIGCHRDIDERRLDEMMLSQGIDPVKARAQRVRLVLRQKVVKTEVYKPIYERITDEEIANYYQVSKDKFLLPEEVAVSELFLSFDDYTPATAQSLAESLAASIRKGAISFTDAVRNYESPKRASYGNDGNLGGFKTSDLKDAIKTAISDLKPGGVTDPIPLPDGYQIIRLDNRKKGMYKPLEDPEVQRTVRTYMTMEQAETAEAEYLRALRRSSVIKRYLTFKRRVTD